LNDEYGRVYLDRKITVVTHLLLIRSKGSKANFSVDFKVRAWELIPFIGAFCRRGLHPINDHMSARWLAQLTASAFNRLGQYASSPGNGAYCYDAELAVSSLAMIVTVASIHCAYPRRDGQAELTWVVD